MTKPTRTFIYAKPGSTVRPGATEPTLMKVRNLATMRHIPPYGMKLELVTDVSRQLLKKDLVKITEDECKAGQKDWEARVAADEKKSGKSKAAADKGQQKAQEKAAAGAAKAAERDQARAEQNEPTA